MKLFSFLKKNIRNAPFSRKIFWAFFLTSSITIIPLGIYSYHQAKNNYLEQEQQRISGQIWQVNTMLNYQLAQYQTVLSSLLFHAQIQQCLNTEHIGYFDQYLMFSNTLEPAIDSIISSHSNILHVKIFTDNQTLKDHSKYLYSLDKLEDTTVITGSQKMIYRIKDNKLIVMSLFPPGGSDLTNILYLEFRIFDTLNMILNMDYKLLLTEDSGNLIYASHGIPEAVRASAYDGLQKVKIQGTAYMLFKNEIPSTGWHSLCFVPESSLSLHDPSILQATFFYLLMACFLCFIMSTILSRWLIRPLQTLHINIKRIEEGDFTGDVKPESADEIGQLTDDFRSMTKKLNVLVNEVYKSQIIQKEAEFKMLQAQLNPHFLYNTLSFINWSALKAGEVGIAKISRDISAFYRTALNSGRTTTTVQEELLNAKSYISIQLALHNNSFDVIYEIEENCDRCEVICNLLQPLIENALEHGIDHIREGRGILKIVIRKETDHLILAVMNNGPCFARDTVKKVMTQDSKGYGLKNVNDRIRIYYGDQYGIVISSEENQDTCVEIRLPLTLIAP